MLRRELRSSHRNAGRAATFERSGDASMHLHSRRRTLTLVEDVPIQRMTEGIASIERAVRQIDDRNVLQPVLALREIVALLCDRSQVLSQHRSKRGGTKLHAAETCCLQQALRFRSKPRDVLLDRAREIFRYGPCRRVRSGDKVVDDICKEQRQTTSVIVQLVDKGFLDPGIGQAMLQILGDFDLRERVEHDFFAKTMQPQFLPQILERMRLRDDLHQPVRAEPHDSRRRSAPREMVEQPQCRGVAPVQVLGQQKQRMLCREASHQLRDLTNLALLVRAGQLAIQRRTVCFRHQPRQLHEPRRCESSHEIRNLRLAAAQRTQRFEYWQIRLTRAVLFDTLTADDDHARQLADELLDERRLADSGIACDPEHGAIASHDVAPRSVQLRKRCRASDHRGTRLALCR